MTKEELLAELAKCEEEDDTETAHAIADDYLILFIDDDDIEKAYRAIKKWYA